MFVIEDELKKLPAKPGVYLMHDTHDTIIYVGKAKILKNRVRQYFQDPARLTPKIRKMVPQIAWFEYIVVDSEMEALVLECNLIKEHRPKYNAMLKDDKMYPYIKITISEEFPRVFITRRMARDKEKYFGPYTNAGACKETMELLRKLYKIRNCSRQISEKDILSGEAKKVRPCLYHDIGQCDAPCNGGISKEEYRKIIDEVEKFLNGDTSSILKMLTAKMQEASMELRFEEAAEYRDKINSINALKQEQKATDFKTEERDIIAYYAEDEQAVIQVFFMRGGRMIGREHYFLRGIESTDGSRILSDFIKQYYSGTPYIPSEILAETVPEDMELIEKWLGEKKGHKVRVIVPKIGTKERMIELAKENARIVFKQDMDKLTREANRTVLAAAEISNLIGLENVVRMESYDISNISGFLNVGSMVVCENGKMKKNDYRKFRIQSVNGPDDYACMKEVLTRRFTHALKEADLEEKTSFGRLPDLILMDGGKGQVNVAKEVLQELGINIPVCGMVKDDNHRTRGLYYNNEEIPINVHGEGFKLLTRIQDETHRFAIEYHKSLRNKNQVHSVLDDIPGIGPARRKALMRTYRDISDVKKATEEELAAIDGMNAKSAKSVYEFFHAEKKN
ncbi:MAG: excinuclease ABC subunit UvrC [Lachnospiraceae bacterium]|nr:excinuclease ABC subunit UvrC [Lachnospiraceae bacterium]